MQKYVNLAQEIHLLLDRQMHFVQQQQHYERQQINAAIMRHVWLQRLQHCLHLKTSLAARRSCNHSINGHIDAVQPDEAIEVQMQQQLQITAALFGSRIVVAASILSTPAAQLAVESHNRHAPPSLTANHPTTQPSLSLYLSTSVACTCKECCVRHIESGH